MGLSWCYSTGLNAFLVDGQGKESLSRENREVVSQPRQIHSLLCPMNRNGQAYTGPTSEKRK